MISLFALIDTGSLKEFCLYCVFIFCKTTMFLKIFIAVNFSSYDFLKYDGMKPNKNVV